MKVHHLAFLLLPLMSMSETFASVTLAGHGKTQDGSFCEVEVEVSGSLKEPKKKEDLKIMFRTYRSGASYLSLDRPDDVLVHFSTNPLLIRARASESGWSRGWLGMPRRYWLKGSFELKELAQGDIQVRANMKGNQVETPFNDVCTIEKSYFTQASVD